MSSAFAVMRPGWGGYLAGDGCDTIAVHWTNEVLPEPILDTGAGPAQTIESLLLNRGPMTGRPLFRRRNKIAGYSRAIAAPKSFSVLDQLGLDSRLAGVAEQATLRTLRLITLLCAPRGMHPDGKTQCDVIGGAACQRLSRLNQPHTHSHFFIYSLALPPESAHPVGANLALLLRSGDLITRFHLHSLAGGLAQLGYAVAPKGNSFTIVGFPNRVEALFLNTPSELARRPKKKLHRTHGDFEIVRQHWLARLSPDHEQSLRALVPRADPPRNTARSFATVLNKCGEQLLAGRLFVPISTLLSDALVAGVGHSQVAPETVAGLLLGKTRCMGPFLVVRENAWHLVSRRNLLANEAECLTGVRTAGAASDPWLASGSNPAWWATTLGYDQHRLVVLDTAGDADLPAVVCGALSAKPLVLNGPLLAVGAHVPVSPSSTVLVRHADRALPQALAEVVNSVLGVGGRLMLLAEGDQGRTGSWLACLTRDAGVPWFASPASGRVSVGVATAEPGVRCAVGDPTEVLSGLLARGVDAVLFCRDMWEQERAVRKLRLRLAARRVLGKGIAVPRLQSTEIPLEPGLVLYATHPVADLRHGEVLRVVSVSADEVTVRRWTGLQAKLPRRVAEKCERFRDNVAELSAGEHLRFPRSGLDAVGRGFVAGQRAVAKTVAPDGMIVATSGRRWRSDCVLWNYAYCVTPEDHRRRRQILVVSARDADPATQAGWFGEQWMPIMVCGDTLAEAEAAVSACPPLRSPAQQSCVNELSLETALRWTGQPMQEPALDL